MIKIDKSAYSSKFYDIIYSHDRYIIAFGGRGSGKTDSFYLKYLLELFQPYYFKLAYINKEFRNIRDNQYAGFKRVAKRIGIYELLKFYDGDYRIVNPINGNSLIPKGMDDPEKTKGLDDITAIWWDEISKSNNLEDFTTLNALLRSPQAQYLQFAISFNPISETHWIRSYFFDKDNAYELNESFRYNTLLNHSIYKDNEFINTDEYLDTLVQNAHGNINRANVDIKGLWGVELNENPFFYSYADKHYAQIDIKPQVQYLDISFDFNKEPCTAVVGQYNPNDYTYKIFDVLTANQHTTVGLSPLEALCEIINRKYINTGLFIPQRLRITGDASGRSGGADYVLNASFYTTIQKRLKISTGQIFIRSSNATHLFSGEVINYFLRYCDFLHNNQFLDSEIRVAYADDKGTLNKAKEEHGLHALDAFRYLIDFWVCRIGNLFTNNFKTITETIQYNVKRKGKSN